MTMEKITDKNKIMRYGCLYKDIYITDGADAYAKRYTQDSDYEVFTCDVLTLIFVLSRVYIDIAENRISRTEGTKRQKEIFSKFNSDAECYGLADLSWDAAVNDAA